MNWKTVTAFLKQLLDQIQQDNATDLAAQLAYYFLLSLFPFLIFTITLLGFTSITTDQVLDLVKRYAPGQTLQLLETNLHSVLEHRNTGLLSFGIIATIWSASNALNALMTALNRAYNVAVARSFLRARALAVLLTFMMIFVILVALLLPVFGQKIGELIFSLLGLSSTFFVIWTLIRWVLSFSIMVGVFVLLYYFAPNKRLRIREVAAGALFTTIGWQLVSLGFAYYVNNFGNFSATYGSLGGIIILMTWFYLTALTIIVGGELNATVHAFANKRKEP
jgi:membrane protein